MSKSNSNLLNYISLLLNDDDALHQFLVDPIQAEEAHGITKAERAVLRRTVAHLSNKSKNGYTVSRHLGSYRRSLRLLQNVLHNVGSKMVQDTHAVAQNTGAPLPLYSMIVYFPFSTQPASNPLVLTCQDNEYIEDNYGSAYTYAISLPSIPLPGEVTIKNLMDAYKKGTSLVPNNYGFDYKTVQANDANGNPQDYVSYITIAGLAITADISQDCYNLKEHPDANSAFWFYSINGHPNQGAQPGDPGAAGDTGDIGGTFTQKVLEPGQSVSWAVIAPDNTYGFQPCVLTDGNKNPNS
ncbi:MAG: hypothetical protein AAF611_09035 [Bacteroidota bacterium]